MDQSTIKAIQVPKMAPCVCAIFSRLIPQGVAKELLHIKNIKHKNGDEVGFACYRSVYLWFNEVVSNLFISADR